MTGMFHLGHARTRLAAGALACVVSAFTAASAHAAIYWSDGNSIGRAATNGANPDPNFITGASGPWQVAVGHGHVYWANSLTGYVGRALLNGSNVDQTFVNTGISQMEGPLGVATSRTALFWSTGAQSDFFLVGTSGLDGSNPHQLLPFFSAVGLAVQGNHLYMDAGSTSIARVNLDGSNETTLITLPPGDFTEGVAVNDHYIYWTTGNGHLGRDTIDGNPANIQQDFVPSSGAFTGIAVDHNYIYWTTPGGAIERDTLDGNPANVDPTFITNTGGALWVAAQH